VFNIEKDEKKEVRKELLRDRLMEHANQRIAARADKPGG
jgi:hypothetical protein